MADVRTLQILLKLKDSASKELEKTGKSFGKFRKTANVAALGAGAAMLGFAAKSVQAAVQFETSMSNINTLFTDNGESVDALSKGIKELLKTTPKSAEDLGASAYSIVSAGISDTSDALRVLEASSRLAVAGLGETSEATDIMTSAINAFQLGTEDAEGIANVFFKAVKNGKTTVSELAQGFGQVAPLANEVGVSFDELLAITSAMTTSGLKASVAYTQVRSALSNLLKPTAEMQEALDLLNITNIKSQIQNEGLQETLNKLKTVSDENNISMAKMFGSVEALNAVLALTGETGELVTTIFDDMQTSSNGLSDAVNEQNATTKNQFNLLKNKLSVVMIDLGTKILPMLVTLMTQVTNIVDKSIESFDKFTTTLSKVFIAYDKIASAAERAFNAMKKAASFVGGKISGAFGALTGRATGGIVKSGETTLVGERGPEIAQFPPGTNITPNNQIGGGGITVNVFGDVSGDELVQKVSDSLMDQIRSNERLTI